MADKELMYPGSLVLNKQQEKAVYPHKGTFLVVAGAGSGKTRIITARIIHLIEIHNVLPSEIIALTFTNKAAKEMRERVKISLAATQAIPFIGTFHAYCLYILKKHYARLDNAPFSILDENDKQLLLKKRIQFAGIHKYITPKQASYQISMIKNNAIDTRKHELLQQNRFLAQLFPLYEEERKASHCLDFDDLLIETLALFKNSDFKKKFQQNISHILVDEYQDTNIVQHALLKQMSLHQDKQIVDSLCAVGDEDQSIYSWRGATVSNILNFSDEFPDTTVITVDQNYRSVNTILDVANAIIRNNKQRSPKILWSNKKASNRVKALACSSEYQEADAIAHYIKRLSSNKQASTAVLYRAHFQSRALEEALVKHSIPYTIIGGTQFYERKEIKDLLAYLRLIVNPFDRSSFFRVINCPTRGFGSKFEELFHAAWISQPFMNFKEVAHELITQCKITGLKKKQLEQFILYFKTLDHTTHALDALKNILHNIDYITHLRTSYDDTEAQTRIDNIQELTSAFKHFTSIGFHTIQDVLNEISLLADNTVNKIKKQQPILLMTLHAAKGLEFDTVIIAGVQESLLPSGRSITEEAIEEERRLFYVGITRAKEHLLFTCSHYRSRYATTEINLPSRFLDEAPSQQVMLQDARYWTLSDFIRFFADWINIQEPLSPVITFKKYKESSTYPNQPLKGAWKLNQPVQHNQFGIGTIKKIDTKLDGTLYVTIIFKTGVKKIDARFIKAL